MASSIQHLSMIMIDKSASVWPSLVKSAATGDLSMRLWEMLNRWLLIQEWRGCPVSPTYWRPHLLHCILQEARIINLKCSPVTLLENVSVVTNMGQVLQLVASQRKLPGWSLILEVISARTIRSRRFLGRQKTMMGKMEMPFEADLSPVECGGNVWWFVRALVSWDGMFPQGTQF